jgi:4-amino-4-deoxy-L-arabinose transferase-like glycosyltransferase
VRAPDTDRLDADKGVAARFEGQLVQHRVVALVLLGLLLYLPCLGLWDLWYPDEPDIGEVAQAMYRSGDWVAPRRMGTIWVDYPPMLYWVGVSSSKLLGEMSPFALRLPNALSAILVAVITCLVGTRWCGPRAGFWAGFMVLSFQQFALQAIGYRPDVLFTLGITGGLFLYAEGCGDKPRLWLRVAGFAMLGFAMLSKGPLGLLLPGLALCLWHASRREWRRLFELAPLALVSMAVYLPWFAACARAMGADSILHELYAQNVARFFGGARGHAQPVYYFVVNIWADLFPWGLLLPFALWWAYRAGQFRDRNQQLLLWWLGSFFVFLSIAVTKRQLYLLPAYPAAALLVAPWIARVGIDLAGSEPRPSLRVLRGFGWAVTLALAVLGIALLVVAGPAFSAFLARASLGVPQLEAAYQARWPLIFMGGVLVVIAAVIGVAARGRNLRGVLLAVGGGNAAIFLLFMVTVMPAMTPAKSYRPAGEWMLTQMGESTHFGLVYLYANFAFRKMGAFGYHTGRLVELMERPEQVEAFFERHPDSVVLVHESAADELFADDPSAWRARVIRDDLYAGGRRYLVLRREPGVSPAG